MKNFDWSDMVNDAGKDVELPGSPDNQASAAALEEIYDRVQKLGSWQAFWTLVCSINLSAASYAEQAERPDLEMVFLSALNIAADVALKARDMGV